MFGMTCGGKKDVDEHQNQNEDIATNQSDLVGNVILFCHCECIQHHDEEPPSEFSSAMCDQVMHLHQQVQQPSVKKENVMMLNN